MRNPHLFKHGKPFIRSMESLIKRYKKAMELKISKSDYEEDRGFSCLLCNPLGVKKRKNDYDEVHETQCQMVGCPWMVILGVTCDEFTVRKGLGWRNRIYNTTDHKIMKARIRQLRNWIKIYEREMKRRSSEQ